MAQLRRRGRLLHLHAHHAGRGTHAPAGVGACWACRRRRCASSPRKWAAASACASTPTRNTARCCLAAKKLGRPVKWVGTRSEVFLADEQARDIVHTGEMALDARRPHPRHALRLSLATSAPTSPSPARSSTRSNLVNVASGVYDVPAVYVQAGSRSPTPFRPPPTAAPAARSRSYAHRAPGGRGGARARPRPGRVPPPQLRAEGEVSLQDRHRLRVRLRRLRGGAGESACSVGLERFREAKAEVRRRRASFAAAASPPTSRRSAAGGFAPYDQAHVTWEKDGTHHAAHRDATTTARATRPRFAQIVSEVLGVPVEKFRLRTSEPELSSVAQPHRRLAHAARRGQRVPARPRRRS